MKYYSELALEMENKGKRNKINTHFIKSGTCMPLILNNQELPQKLFAF